MDDRFLNEHHREPRSGFAHALRERLRGLEELEAEDRGWLRLAPVSVALAGAALVAALFLIPSVRIAAQSVLDLFRVRTFAAVQFDAARLDKLKELAGARNDEEPRDLTLLGIEKTETLKDPGKPAVYPSLGAASLAANLSFVRTPAWLPGGMKLDTVMVQGEGAARLTVRAARLRSLLDALDLRDVQVPANVDGQQLTVRMPPAVIQNFRSDRREAHLLQATSPEVTLPPGVDLAQLGEIGLRILGLEPGEAHRMAHAIDWRTTLLVPVPINAASFRQVSVQGHPALLITSNGGTVDGHMRREGSMLLWTEGDRVLALGGELREMELMQIAESLR